jgi:putative transport protein
LLGSIEITLPGGILFSLGFAGGPLVAGLLLSYLRRSGPILWTLPYSANLTLRQIGLMLMLATIGINSGAAFPVYHAQPGGTAHVVLRRSCQHIWVAVAILLIGYKF